MESIASPAKPVSIGDKVKVTVNNRAGIVKSELYNLHYLVDFTDGLEPKQGGYHSKFLIHETEEKLVQPDDRLVVSTNASDSKILITNELLNLIFNDASAKIVLTDKAAKLIKENLHVTREHLLNTQGIITNSTEEYFAQSLRAILAKEFISSENTKDFILSWTGKTLFDYSKVDQELLFTTNRKNLSKLVTDIKFTSGIFKSGKIEVALGDISAIFDKNHSILNNSFYLRQHLNILQAKVLKALTERVHAKNDFDIDVEFADCNKDILLDERFIIDQMILDKIYLENDYIEKVENAFANLAKSTDEEVVKILKTIDLHKVKLDYAARAVAKTKDLFVTELSGAINSVADKLLDAATEHDYLWGGAVRDELAGKTPKDLDFFIYTGANSTQLEATTAFKQKLKDKGIKFVVSVPFKPCYGEINEHLYKETIFIEHESKRISVDLITSKLNNPFDTIDFNINALKKQKNGTIAAAEGFDLEEIKQSISKKEFWTASEGVPGYRLDKFQEAGYSLVANKKPLLKQKTAIEVHAYEKNQKELEKAIDGFKTFTISSILEKIDKQIAYLNWADAWIKSKSSTDGIITQALSLMEQSNDELQNTTVSYFYLIVSIAKSLDEIIINFEKRNKLSAFNQYTKEDLVFLTQGFEQNTNKATVQEKEEKTMKAETKMTKPGFFEMTTEDAKDAAWRLGAKKMSEAVKTGIVQLLKNKGKLKTKKEIDSFREVLDTPWGESAVSVLIGYGLTYAPMISEDPRAKRLAKEFRVGGMATFGNELTTLAIDSLLPEITKTLASLPEVRVVDKTAPEEEAAAVSGARMVASR